LGVLLRYLPRESAYAQAVFGDRARWGPTEHLLASLIDVSQVGNYLAEITASNRQLKGNAPTAPKPIPRPGEVVPVRSVGGRSPADVAKLLGDWRSGRLTMIETEAKEVT
jgi:hypothetical protein